MGIVMLPLAFVVGMGLLTADRGRQELPGEAVVGPRLATEGRLVYPPSALEAGTEGVVVLECVVQEDGTPANIRVRKSSLHPALDEAAIRALTESRYFPATRGGKPIAAPIEVEMSFSVRDGTGAHRGPPLDSPGVYKKADGVTLPVLVKEVHASYTPDTLRARVQGLVRLEGVVLPDGTVGDVRITSPLNPQLDAECLRVFRQWIFKPGTKDGVAVPVRIEVEMTFTLGTPR